MWSARDRQTRDCETCFTFKCCFIPELCMCDWEKERKKKHSAFPPNQQNLHPHTDSAQHEARPAAVCAVCVSLPAPALSVCPSLTTHTHTHTHYWWFSTCMLSESCIVCQSCPPTSGSSGHCDLASFLSSAERIAVFEGIGDVMAYVSDFVWDERLWK